MTAPVRTAIIDAVDALVRQRGWTATTMADVARAAGISRQTVYNEFGTRQVLVQAYVEREIEMLIDGVEAQVRANSDDARTALAGAFRLFLTLASDEPVVRVIVSEAGGDDLIRLLTAAGLSLATERVGGLISAVWPQVSSDDARLLASSLARLAISHAVVPTDSAADAASAVTRLVGPFVDQALG